MNMTHSIKTLKHNLKKLKKTLENGKTTHIPKMAGSLLQNWHSYLKKFIDSLEFP